MDEANTDFDLAEQSEFDAKNCGEDEEIHLRDAIGFYFRSRGLYLAALRTGELSDYDKELASLRIELCDCRLSELGGFKLDGSTTSKSESQYSSSAPSLTRTQIQPPNNLPVQPLAQLLLNKNRTDAEQIEDDLMETTRRPRKAHRFADLAGSKKVKRIFHDRVIDPLTCLKHLYKDGSGRSVVKGIMLYGPPGTGKSYLTVALANELPEATFFNMSGSDIISKYEGDSAKIIAKLIELARKNQPSIIFIDEFDAICKERTEKDSNFDRRILSELLSQIDGSMSLNTDQFVIIGATNRPAEIDIGIARRFPVRIFVGLPNFKARRALIKSLLKNVWNFVNEKQLDRLASDCDSCTNDDIKNWINAAVLIPEQEMKKAKYFKKITGILPGSDIKVDEAFVPCRPNQGQRLDFSEIPEGMAYPAALEFINFPEPKRTVTEKIMEQSIKFAQQDQGAAEAFAESDEDSTDDEQDRQKPSSKKRWPFSKKH